MKIDRFTAPNDLPQLARVPEVAAFADCSNGVIYAAIRCGELAHIRLGRLLRIPRTAIVAWMEGKNGNGGHA